MSRSKKSKPNVTDREEIINTFTKTMSAMREKFSNMTITCQGKRFTANAALLSAHSEVFAAMLAHDTKEANDRNIEIVDAEPDTVEAFLVFLYEFKLPPLNVEMAANLMLMGDKYNVPSLVAGCRSYFSKNLREDDLVKAAILGYLCKEDGVKDAAISMMGKVVGPLSTLKDWKKLEAHPALALEIADRVTRMKQQEVEKQLKSATKTSDSGFGTTTMSSNGHPPFSLDIRQPLLAMGANISEVGEDKRSFYALNRARSATPLIPQPSAAAAGNIAPKYSSAESMVFARREERPRSASLDRGPTVPWGGRMRTATAPPTSSPQISLAPQINALRLKPHGRRPQRLRAGISAAVLTNGEVEIDFEIKKKSMRMRVSKDGWNISVDKRAQGQDEVESYTYKSLPKCYWQKYNILAKVVRHWRESTSKVTFYPEDARCDLMENEPVANFKVAFSDGTKINYCSATGQITYKASEKTSSLTFSYPLTTSSIDKGILVYLKNFEKWHSLCKTMEKHSSDTSNECFPVVLGRKAKSPATSTSTVSAATTTVTTTTVAPPPAPSTATGLSRLSISVSAALNVSHISRHSQERGAYRVYTFPDGTVLEMPKDTTDSKFRYRNRRGQWETNFPQESVEMQEKMNQIEAQMYKSRNKLQQQN